MPVDTMLQDQIRDDAIRDLGLHEQIREPTFNRVVQIAATAFRAPNVAFSILFQDAQIYLAVKGLAISQLPADQAICSITTRRGQALIMEDTRQSELAAHPGVASSDGVRFYAGIPVRAPGGETIGSFCLFDTQPRRMSLSEHRMLGECAGLIEDALHLRGLASRDSLTGLLNRREFDIRLKTEIRRARRDGSHLTVALIDIDHFKFLNDALGHDAGDAALRLVAQQLESLVRSDRDCACRYGGEEFALILPGMPLLTAQQRMQALRMALRQVAIKNPGSPSGLLTVSCGLARLQLETHSSLRDLLLRADAALYQAKRDGRDRTVCAEVDLQA